MSESWEREAQALGVTSANWLEAPYNRLGFRRVGKLVRTARISRGDGPVVELPQAERDLGGFRFAHEGRSLDLDTMLTETYTDGFLVIHDGGVITERYPSGMAPSDTHLLMSVSKSFNSTLCGVLVGQGALTPDDLVTDHLDELRGSAWEGCTVQHLLDMRVGARWDYDVDEYTILDVSDYRTHDRTDIPADTATWIRTVDATHAHGGPFGYNSLANDVLGWVLERAGGKPYPELFSQHIWSVLGAEHDAEIMLDHSGFAIVEGGFCATLRDLARFGLMCLQDGEIGGRRVCPAEWVGTAQGAQPGAHRRVRRRERPRRPSRRGLLPRQLVDLGGGARRLCRRRHERAEHLRAPSVEHGDREALDVPGRARRRALRPAPRRHVGAVRVPRLRSAAGT